MANAKFEIYRGEDKNTEQCWRWRLLDTNGKNIAKSEEPFLKENIQGSIKKMRNEVTEKTPIHPHNSPEKDGGVYRFEYQQSNKDGQWRWELKAGGNSETMAEGGEGFSSEQSIIVSLRNVRSEIPSAEIKYKNPDDDPANDAKKAEEETPTRGIPGS